jgi:multicomponent Na+:H+ antiporter subunit E
MTVLLAIYLLALGSVAPGDIAIGLALAVAMELGWRRRVLRGGTVGDPETPSAVPLHRAVLALPRLVWGVLVEITRGTWTVALHSLGLREPDRHGFVEVAIEGVSEEGVALWAFISTVSPGEVVVELDEERGVLVLHALDASDPEAIRRNHHRFYERYQRSVLP